MNQILRGIAVTLASAVVLAAPVMADNVMANPSAENAAADGSPTGWGLYVGAGQLKLSSVTDQKHSGERSACLETLQWQAPKDGADVAAKRSASGAIVLAPNDGYKAQGAIPCMPKTAYAFSFWYKGDVPAASVAATGWPSADAGHGKRIEINVADNRIMPGPEWKKHNGRIRIPEGVRCFALSVCVSSVESDGGKLGKKLYLDDVSIMPREYPDGELRAVWGPLPESKQRDEGLRQINASLDKVKSGGFNTMFVLVWSRYLAAMDEADLREAEPQAAWDSFGEVIKAAKTRGIQVQLWFSPWIYKDKSRSGEMMKHPDWAAVSSRGEADDSGLCFVRPEVRQYELNLLANVIDRYPDLAGIHIEEPGYNWGKDYCYCDHCRQFCLANFGRDIRKDPEAAKPIVHSLAAFMCTDFFIRLREMMTAKRPEMWLSANGSGGPDREWYIGRDWQTWARRDLIDFYVPQLYTNDVNWFTKRALESKECLGGQCDIVTGMAVSWSGIYPKRQPPEIIAGEIAAARKVGAKGFSVFYAPYLEEGHYRAIRGTIQGKADVGAKP